jgi:hypothetical protein
VSFGIDVAEHRPNAQPLQSMSRRDKSKGWDDYLAAQFERAGRDLQPNGTIANRNTVFYP